MPKTSIGPEAKLIRDFDLLSPEGQRIVRDIINAKQPARTQEARAPRASKKGLPPAAKPDELIEVKPAKPKKCDVCYEEKGYPVHDKSMGYADYHEFDPGKPGKKKRTEAQTPTVVDIQGDGDGNSALAAGAGD